MAEPLSIAASSFAIVGVVDVVLRASVKCCRFLSEIKDAPTEIDTLRTCIKETTQLVETLKGHLDLLRDSASSIVSSTVDLNSTVDGFNSSVRALHRELNALQTLAKKYGGADATWAKVKWVLNGRKISKSLEKLERSKSTLSVALSLVEGRQSAFTQKRIENSIQQGFQQLTSTMNAKLQELSTVRANQEKLLAGQEKAILHSTQQLKKSNLIREDLVKVAQTQQTENDKTQGKIAAGNQKVINIISSKFEELHIAIPKVPTAATNSNREIFFIGGHRESILPTLLLMKEYIHRAALDLVSHHTKEISPRHLYFLRSEFDNLVISAIQEAAASCQGSTATSTDQWIYSTRSDTRYNTVLPLANLVSRCGGKYNKRARAEFHGSGPQKRLCFRYESYSFRSPVGKLCLAVPRNSDDANLARNIDEVYFSFVPTPGISSYAIGAHFIESMNSRLEPKLYTQLNAFRIIEDQKLHSELFSCGSISDIDDAFRNGVISPYDQHHGIIISLWLASLNSRREVLGYLDSQGVGLEALNGELDVLESFWFNIQNFSIEMGDDLIPILKAQAYFEDKITTCIPTRAQSLLHANVCDLYHFPDEYSEPIKIWMDFLKRNDYNFELRDENGRTPLLHNLGGTGEKSLAIVRLLLEFGANPHAVDSFGRNAIQIAISSIKYHPVYEGDREVIERKLGLLIKFGVNLRHSDEKGHTASCYARSYLCWPEWCWTLIQNGIVIDEVVGECKESLLEESSDEGYDEECDEESDDEESVTW